MTTENQEAPNQEGAAAVACTDWLGRFALFLIGIGFCSIATFAIGPLLPALLVELIGIGIQCVAFLYRPNH